MELRNEMTKCTHQAGLKIVGEVLPQEKNRVELADETDELGLRIPRVTFSYGEEDRKLYRHAVNFMTTALEPQAARISGRRKIRLISAAPVEWAPIPRRA